MKSAYELAMERLDKESGPSKKLTGDQKARIAEIDNTCEAKTAEMRLAYDVKFQGAATLEELEKFKAELAESLASLEATRERQKQAVWDES